MKRNGFYSAVLAAVMAGVMIAGCSSGTGKGAAETQAPAGARTQTETAGEQKEAAPAQEKELIMWHNRGGSNGKFIEEQLIPEFNDTIGKSAGVKVVPVYQDEDIVSKLKALILANDVANMPDLVTIYAGDVEYMSTVKNVVPLDSFLEADSDFKKEDMVQSLWDTYNFRGKQYSIPFTGDAMIFYYNKTAFEKAGLDPENPPKTIAEMADCAEKLLIKDGDTVKQYGITLGLQNVYLNNWIGGQGDYHFIGNNEGGRTGRMTKVTFDEDGTMLTLLNEWQKVLDTGAVQSVDVDDQPKDEFCSGLSAMFCGGNWAMTSIIEAAKENGFELGISELPRVLDTDKGGVCPGGTSLYILDRGDSDVVNTGWEFMKYWSSAETQTKLCIATGYIPTNGKTMETEEMKAFLKDNPSYRVAFDSLMKSNPKVQEHLAPTQQEFQLIFRDTSLRCAKGEITAQECVDSMAEQCNRALDEYNEANPVEE